MDGWRARLAVVFSYPTDLRRVCDPSTPTSKILPSVYISHTDKLVIVAISEDFAYETERLNFFLENFVPLTQNNSLADQGSF
jgi:hypothetical protein